MAWNSLQMALRPTEPQRQASITTRNIITILNV
jgi:hypothetical protein